MISHFLSQSALTKSLIYFVILEISSYFAQKFKDAMYPTGTKII